MAEYFSVQDTKPIALVIFFIWSHYFEVDFFSMESYTKNFLLYDTSTIYKVNLIINTIYTYIKTKILFVYFSLLFFTAQMIVVSTVMSTDISVLMRLSVIWHYKRSIATIFCDLTIRLVFPYTNRKVQRVTSNIWILKKNKGSTDRSERSIIDVITNCNIGDTISPFRYWRNAIISRFEWKVTCIFGHESYLAVTRRWWSYRSALEVPKKICLWYLTMFWKIL